MKAQQYSILLVALVIIHGTKGISNILTNARRVLKEKEKYEKHM